MLIFLEQVLNGLTVGSLYALVVTGLALTVGVLRVVNFSHGDLFMLGAYIFYFFFAALELAYLPAATLTIVVMAGVGLLFERLVIRKVVTRSWQIQLVATLAAATILNNGVIVMVGSMSKSTPTSLNTMLLQVGTISISYQRLLILAITGVAFLGLHNFLKHTRAGKAMRAVSQNREAAESAGIDISHISRLTFLLSAALIGLSAALVTPVYSVFPAMGMVLTIKAFAVLTVGGFGRVNGAVPAAFLLGIAEAVGTGYLSSSYTDAFAFAAMILVLLVAPQGIFGRKVGIY
jgi:branched-chain amino acid transport system permease protein